MNLGLACPIGAIAWRTEIASQRTMIWSSSQVQGICATRAAMLPVLALNAGPGNC